MQIRPIEERDAERFLELSRRLDRETRMMLLEPDERATTVEQQIEAIRAMQATTNQTILVAEQDGQLVGYIGGFGGGYRRIRHNVTIVVGVLAAFRGQGIGTHLFEALEAWARRQGLHRLELVVMVHNEVALRLYTKLGFAIEGTLRHAIKVDGEFIDEYTMAKLLT